MNHTRQQMLDLIQASRDRLNPDQTRELQIANDANSREVYKDIKIKRVKYVSRLSEEPEALPSAPVGEEIVSLEDNNIPPATTSSRITGITMQHVKTNKGIKLNVAVQTAQDAVNGEYVELTAELKRHGRLRELKRYEPDDVDFQDLYLATIEDLKSLKPDEGRYVAMGRLHIRGARGHWFANMMVVARLDDAGLIQSVLFNCNGEEFEIAMTGTLSPNQIKLYHSTGIYGNLQSRKPAPRLETARRKVFNP